VLINYGLVDHSISIPLQVINENVALCLKRICSLDTSAFSALEILDDNYRI